jgi:hypothetical protein
MDGLEVIVSVFLVVCGILARAYLRGWFRPDAEELARKHKAMDAPRWERKGPQLVGRACVQCHERIVFQIDAEQCSRCTEPVHLACADLHAQAHGDP